jgi:hypothetical protein
MPAEIVVPFLDLGQHNNSVMKTFICLVVLPVGWRELPQRFVLANTLKAEYHPCSSDR